MVAVSDEVEGRVGREGGERLDMESNQILKGDI